MGGPAARGRALSRGQRRLVAFPSQEVDYACCYSLSCEKAHKWPSLNTGPLLARLHPHGTRRQRSRECGAVWGSFAHAHSIL